MSAVRLRVIEGPAAGREIELDDELLIGRSSAADSPLGDDSELSRRHARLSVDAHGSVVVEDLGSTNGTFLNGKRINAPSTLGRGDHLRLGLNVLELAAIVAPAEPTVRASTPAAVPAADADPPERLQVLIGPAGGSVIPIGAALTFGRDAEGPGQLGADAELSRQHARISREADGTLLLEDLGSSNGTYLNDWRIPSPQALSDGDRIGVGQSLLELTGIPRSAARPASVIGSSVRDPTSRGSDRMVLTVEGVKKSYSQREILKGIDLEVAAGEVVGLLGPNGAGKTTLVSIVAGLRPATAGKVTISGVDALRSPRLARAHLGIAPQDLGLYPVQTVRRNLEFFGEISGLRRPLLGQRVEEVGAALSLTELFDRKAAILSGGQKRRLHTGMAMLHHPALLILDEPTVGADIRTRQEILDAVKHLAAEGRAICYSTHYLPEIEDLGASVAILDDGRIVARGSIAELVAKHSTRAVEFTFAGEAPSIDLGVLGQITREGSLLRIICEDPTSVGATVISRLGPHAARLRGVEIVTPSLDSVYLNLTERRYAGEGDAIDASRLPPPVAIPAGWYQDPAGAGQLRFWDGQGWTDSLAPARN
jgi:ABC-2 type transport system ATP-binding protein